MPDPNQDGLSPAPDAAVVRLDGGVAPAVGVPSAPPAPEPYEDFRFEWQDTQDGDRRRAAEEFASKERPSFAATFKAAVELESLTKAIFGGPEGGGPPIDPSYRMDEAWLIEQAKAREIPQEYLGSLSGAYSEQHAILLLDRIKTELDAANTLSQAGWEGTALQLLVGILDPSTVAVSFTPGGVAAWLKRGGAVKAALRGAAMGGATNAAIEAALASTQVTRSTEDIVFAGLIGLTLGGAIGSVSGLLAKNAEDVFSDTALRHARKAAGTDIPRLTYRSAADDPAGRPRLRGPDAPLEGEYIPNYGRPVPYRAPEAPLPFAERVPLDALPPPAKKLGGPPEPEPVFGGLLEDPAIVAERAAAQAGAGPSSMADQLADVKRQMADRAANEATEAARAEAAKMTANRVAAEKEQLEAFRAGDLVEWDGPHGTVEKGEVISTDPDTGTVNILDERGNVRKFRAKEVDHDTGVGLDDPAAGGFLSGSIGAAQIGQISNVKSRWSGTSIKIGKWNIPIRFDAFAYFDRTDNQELRKLASLLIDDPVGKEGGAANPISASEYAGLEFRRYYSQANDAVEKAFVDFVKRTQPTVQDRLRAGREFAFTVSRVLRDTSGGLKAMHPEAARAAQEIAEVNARILKKMQELGVEGADEVAVNANYLMRRFDFDKIARLYADKRTRTQMHRLVGEAIQRVRPDVDPVRAREIGKTFIQRLRTLKTDPKNLDFLPDGGFRRFAAALREGGVFDEQEIDDILDLVFNRSSRKPGDSAAHPRMKKRAFLDESHSVKWADPDGKEHTLKFDDLLENDIRTLNQIYMRQAAGMIGLAKVGIRSKADYQTLREAARMEDVNNGVLDAVIEKRLTGMDRVMRNILGQPMYDEMWGDGVSRFMRVVRNLNVATYLAQVGFAQLAETGHLLATKTAMAMRTNMSAYDNIANSLQRGTASADLKRDLKMMAAISDDEAIRRPYMRDHDPSEAFGGTAEDVSALGAHYTMKLSGMSWLTEHQRGIIAKMYSQRLLNIAVGAEKMDDGLRKRLATNGLEEDELDSVLEAYKRHAQVDSDGRTVVGIDYHAWEAASPKTFDLFRLAVYRESHRSIQEVSIGAAPLWMHSDTGKLLFQFRSFVLNAYTKQLMYGLQHFDLQTFATWSFSIMAASLSYTAQTYVNYAGNEKELERRLDPLEIGKAGFQRAGLASLIPMAVDTAAGFALGDPVFKYGRTSNLGTGWILGIPTVATVGKISGLASALTQDVFTDDHMWTQKEVGYGTGLIPQLVFIRAGLDTFKQEFPKRNPLRENEPQ